MIEKKKCVQDKIVFNRHKIFKPILEFNHQTLIYVYLLVEDRLILLILYYSQVLKCFLSLHFWAIFFQRTLLKSYYFVIFLFDIFGSLKTIVKKSLHHVSMSYDMQKFVFSFIISISKLDNNKLTHTVLQCLSNSWDFFDFLNVLFYNFINVYSSDMFKPF